MTTTQQQHSESPAVAETDARDNIVTWWEIQVSDLDAAKTFYGAVFAWTFTDFYERFAICHAADGTMIGGLDRVDGEVAGRGVRLYVRTTDLEATLDRVVQAGGTVIKPRAVISEEFGWYALLADPQGVTIGLTTDRPARQPA